MLSYDIMYYHATADTHANPFQQKYLKGIDTLPDLTLLAGDL